MKKILLTVSTAAILLAACNSDKKDPLSTDKQVVFSDTSTLNKSNPGTDVPAAGATTTTTVAPAPSTAAPQPQVRTVTKYVTVHDKQRSKTPAAMPPASTTQAPPTTQGSAPPSTEAGATGSTATTGTSTGTTTGTTTPATIPAKKNTGWSQTAKDATIGGVGGAVIGAVIGKGGKGAVIGGVIGAAGGYILGRKADKASGRVGNNTTTTTTTP